MSEFEEKPNGAIFAYFVYAVLLISVMGALDIGQ
jgi:hypothetical protein